MSSPRIDYVSYPDVKPEAEVSTLANAYRFILECRDRNEAATSPVCRPDAEKGSKHDSRHVQSTP
jgi:hypothetical protein